MLPIFFNIATITFSTSDFKADYINSGKVLLEYREVYFDGPGLWAGLLARCQGDQKYFPMIDLIFRKQKDWARGNRDEIINLSLIHI